MRFIEEKIKKTPIIAQTDVLVAGGGPAGIAAAVAAARCGAKVMLVERYGYLGGLATGGLVLYMDHLFDRTGVRCIGGICWEVMERLSALDGAAGYGSIHIHVDSELLKIVADKICVESGVILRLHSWVVDTVMDEEGVVGIIVESKSGRQVILSSVVVDATGDADIAAFAGSEFEMHTMRIGLNCKIGGVDRDRFLKWKGEHPQDAGTLRKSVRSNGGCPLDLGDTPQSDRGVFWVNDVGLSKRQDTASEIPAGDDSFIGGLNAIDVEDISAAEVELRGRILRGIEYYRAHVQGYEHVHLLSIAAQLGVRDSRRLAGVLELTKSRLDQDVKFNDTIGITGMTFPEGNHLAVPYRALVPKKTDGLIAAGRCISVDDGLIHSIRLIPPCLMTGQAAGAAAALSVGQDIQIRDLAPELLRRRLEEDGAILDL